MKPCKNLKSYKLFYKVLLTLDIVLDYFRVMSNAPWTLASPFPLEALLPINAMFPCSINSVQKIRELAHLVKRNAGPSLTPFDATNLNLLKISHLDRTGIPCSICRLNCIQDKLPVSFTFIPHLSSIHLRPHIISITIWRNLTWKKLWSFAFAYRDSCFRITMLSWGLPLHNNHLMI